MSDSPATITGKIAAVIDATTLVLNVGQQQGVREGMTFAVIAAHQQITDPDTGENLGLWEVVKGRVIVTHVQERMCTAQSAILEQSTASSTLSEMMVRHSFGLSGNRSQQADRVHLDVVHGAVSGRPRVTPIAVGDVVHSVILPISESVPDAAEKAGDLPSQAYASPGTSEDPQDTDG